MSEPPLIVDGHEDIANHCLENERSYFSRGDWMLSYQDHMDAPVTLAFATIYIRPEYKPRHSKDQAAKQMEFYRHLLERAEHNIELITDLDELDTLLEHNEEHPETEERKLGLVLLMEGADPIAHPGDLSSWVGQGLRLCSLTWSLPNRYAIGNKYPEGPGVKSQGRQLLMFMKREGVILDTSHLNPQSFEDALDIWEGESGELPVIASHSNCREVFEPEDDRAKARNLYDWQLEAIAEQNGAVGIVLYNDFLSAGGTTDLDDVWAHIYHIAETVGIDHVAVGSDFDGGITADETPEPFETVADLPELATYLSERRNLDDQEVAKIMGGNWLRVLREAWSE